ncbi:hypothetical protein Pelo_1148 [Pelomyxa schiedti]|nr:hypothetical protein Pelo_1148 [Pelomyxa schiedti]
MPAYEENRVRQRETRTRRAELKSISFSSPDSFDYCLDAQLKKRTLRLPNIVYLSTKSRPISAGFPMPKTKYLPARQGPRKKATLMSIMTAVHLSPALPFSILLGLTHQTEPGTIDLPPLTK